MTRGLWRKTFLETWVQLVLFGLALSIVALLLTMLLPQLERGLNRVLVTLPFVRNIVQALLGDDLGPRISAHTLQGIIWVHPTILALLWAQEIVFCTRMPAGEIDRGTVDTLLSWPVSRRKLFYAETVAWLACGIVLCLMLLAGNTLARKISPTVAPHSWRNVLFVICNLYSLYVAVGGLAWLVSAISNQRGRAMGVVFALLLASFLLNFLVQFWEQAEPLAPLGVLNYYRPANILATGHLPLEDLAVLWTVGVLAWWVGLEVFARRSICTL